MKRKIFALTLILSVLVNIVFSLCVFVVADNSVEIPIKLSFVNATGLDINIRLDQNFVDKAEIVRKSAVFDDAIYEYNQQGNRLKISVASVKALSLNGDAFYLKLSLKKVSPKDAELAKVLQVKVNEKISFQAEDSILISGVENNKKYGSNLVVTYNEGTARLNNQNYISGSIIRSEGVNTLTITDLNGKQRIVRFTQDFTPPIITVSYSTTAFTNQNVTVFASVNEGTLNKTSHVFTSNGSFEFIAVDDVGNESRKTVAVSNIDKVKPVIIAKDGSGKVLASGSTSKDKVTVSIQDLNLDTRTVTRNETSIPYPASGEFNQDGRYVITAKDKANNTATFSFAIERIEEVSSATYTVNNSTNQVTKVSAETTIAAFLARFDYTGTISVYQGNNKLSNAAFVGTGMELRQMQDGKVIASYIIIVTGDINGDGKINVTDMIAQKAHILGRSTLKGVYLQAADTSGDGKVNITDFIQIKAHTLGKEKIVPKQ